MRIPIARQGAPYIALGLVLTLGFGVWGSRPGAALLLLLTGFVTAFFRDPERQSPSVPGAILAPADGRVLLVEPFSGDGAGEGSGVKISIFMSVFNCHVNRFPAAGVIRRIDYRPGRFLAAQKVRASSENEQNALRVQTDEGGELTVVQIAGLIARRIVCWVKAGDRLAAGERFGLIQFGSRLDLYLPPGVRVAVHRGDRTKAGLTIVGYFS